MERNNFHLIRLFAAVNVMVLHSWHHFRVEMLPLSALMEAVPGVPIFFVISGFLVTRSWERSRKLKVYAARRALRIFPGLWACLAVSLLLMTIAGYRIDAPAWQIAAWIFAQLTIGQNVTPGFFSAWPTGALNGALWTIPVELQFYILTPFAFRWLPKWTVFPLIAAFAVVNQLPRPEIPIGPAVFPTGAMFPAFYYMFLLGAAAHFYWDRVRLWVDGRFLLWAGVYVASCLACWALGWTVGTNNPAPVLMVVLALLVLSAAYSAKGLSNALIGENDISYGVYLYHMPVITFLLAVGLGGPYLAIAISVALACLSWFVVERRALRLKWQRPKQNPNSLDDISRPEAEPALVIQPEAPQQR